MAETDDFLDKTQAYALVRKLKEYEWYAERFLKIRDKKGRIVPFQRNAAQKKLRGTIERLILQGIPPRIIILKARQMGFSTETEAEIFHRTATELNRKAIIVAQDLDSSANLFEMFRRYHGCLPEPLRPEIDRSNEKKLKFGELQSEIRVTTAEKREKLGRSATVQDLHASEVAFWSDAENAMLALLQIIPDELNTLVIAESTANGVGGWFYDTFTGAMQGENDWTPLFFAWFENPEYRKEFRTKEERENFHPSEYLLSLQKIENLDLEQLYWYDWTMRNKAKGSPDKMKQEYPSTAEEAFIVSGRNVFLTDLCMAKYKESENAERGSIDFEGKFTPNRKGNTYRWADRPEPNARERNRYAAGVDVAEGLENGDYSVCRVIDRKTDKVVLKWRGHIDPDLFAYRLYAIQKYFYDDIFFEVEKNNHGLTTITRAFELGVNIKYTEKYESGHTPEATDELGFKTNSKTKPLIIDALGEWIREGHIEDKDKIFWGETLVYVEDEKGRTNAMPGRHDDEVIAQALAINCYRWMPNYYIEPEPEPTRLPAKNFEITPEMRL